MDSNIIPIQKRMAECLHRTQILYQNKCIDANLKNQIVKLIQQSRHTNDMGELNNIFRGLLFGTTMPDVVEELISITKA